VSSPRRRPALNSFPRNAATANTILWGKARSYHVANFPGPLSIKSVIRGSAVWETDDARWVLGPGSYLILNHGRTYSITVDSDQPVETFCLFFQPGFVEDVWRSSVTPSELLLEDSRPQTSPANFFERIQPPDAVTALLKRMHGEAVSGESSRAQQEEDFVAAAEAMLQTQRSVGREAARITAVKSSTRQELLRRVSRGRDFIESSLTEPITLAQMAHAACLSPYHFHRLFRTTFGERPHQYVVRRRLERATAALRSSDIPITQVCLESGFESLGSFSALFRRRYGTPPSQWRMAHQ